MGYAAIFMKLQKFLKYNVEKLYEKLQKADFSIHTSRK